MMMGMLKLLIVTLLIVDDSSGHINEECIVKERFNRPAIKGDTYNWVAFITEDNDLRIHVSFVERNYLSDNDVLHVKYDQLNREIKRNGIVTEIKNISSNISLIGWKNFSTNVESGFMNLTIDSYNFPIEFEYPVRHVAILSSQMSSCVNGKPSWKIAEGKNSIIPTVGLGTVYFVFSSSKSFSPVIYLNKVFINLYYANELEVEIGKNSDNLLLPKGRYEFKLEMAVKRLSLSYKQPENGFESILEVKRKDKNITMVVSSLNEDFLLELMVGYRMDEISANPTTTNILNNTAPVYNPERSTEEAKSSYTTLYIIISVFGCLIIMIFISRPVVGKMFYDLKCKVKAPADTKTDLEKQPLMDSDFDKSHERVSAKDKIKSEKTEQLGEFNSKFGYQKEICKLKLESDQNCSYKKTLGKLDERRKNTVILAVGETGSGKSSVINAMANCIYGVEYKDPFRFKLVDDMDTPHEIGINTTEEITSYYIPYTPGIANASNYILIDTPGFGDLRGIDEDTKLVTKFFDFLKKNPDITEVDAICFVIKASDTRLTDIQNYIISGLFSMFGKDVIRNIYVVVSHSDGTMTHVPKLLMDSGLKYESEIMHFDSKGLFNESEVIEDTSDDDIQEDFQEKWTMTMTCIENFFKALRNKTPVSLILTNMVLEENEDITKLMDELIKLVEKEELTTEVEKNNIQAKIEQNQSLIMLKLNEAKKLTGRLKNIPLKENPLAINDYIDFLMTREENENEKNENKIEELKKLKNRNTVFQNLLRGKESNSFNFSNFFFGKKYEKTD